MAGRHYVKFTFLKLDPAWRRLDPEERARHKREFAAACNDFAEDHFLRAYSLVGTRGDADLMIRTSSPRLEAIHELHVVLNQSGLMAWADIGHSFLAMTKESVYSDERMRVMRGHIETGRRYSGIEINTAYSFGLDDQEFVVSFNADDPGEFLDLVQELRSTESSAYTESETPIFTCISASPERALDALDGEAMAATLP